MQQEVKENKRFKISDRSVSSDKLFANPKLTPTVGAGGQYSVTPQKPQQSSWERLAEGLGSMMGAAGAIQQSTVAANEASEKVVGEMTDREFQDAVAKAQEAQDVEKGMFDAGKFVDKLTRTGSASIAENPLTYTRGLQAAGLRVGREEYAPLVEQRLMDARKNMAANPDASYSIEQIQGEVKQELMDKYGMEGTFSMQRGFEKAIASEMKAQKIRDINEQDRLTRSRMENDGAMAWSVAMEKMDGSPADAETMADFNRLTASSTPQEVIKMMAKSIRDTAIDSPDDLGKIEKFFRESGHSVAGYPLDSPAFASVRTLIDDLQDRAEDKVKVDNAKAERDLTDKFSSAASAIQNPNNQTFSDAGVDVGDSPIADKVYNNKEEMLLDYFNHQMTQVPKGQKKMWSAVLRDTVYKRSQAVEATVKAEERENFYRDFTTASTETSSLAKEVESEYKAMERIADQTPHAVLSASREAYQELQTNLRSDGDAGFRSQPPQHTTPAFDEDGKEIPWSERKDKKDQYAYSRRKHIEQYRKSVGEALAKQEELDAVELDKAYNENADDSKKNDVKTKYKSFEPHPVFLEQSGGKPETVWGMAKAEAGDNSYRKMVLENPEHQKSLRSIIDKAKEVHNNDGVINYRGKGRGRASRNYRRELDLEKHDNLALTARSYMLYTKDDLDTLTERGYLTPEGSTNGFVISPEDIKDIKIKVNNEDEKKELFDKIKSVFPLYNTRDFEASIYTPSK